MSFLDVSYIVMNAVLSIVLRKILDDDTRKTGNIYKPLTYVGGYARAIHFCR